MWHSRESNCWGHPDSTSLLWSVSPPQIGVPVYPLSPEWLPTPGTALQQDGWCGNHSCHLHSPLQEDWGLRHVPDHHGHPATAHLEPGLCMLNVQPRRQRLQPTRLSFPSPQGRHHDMGAFPDEWFNTAFQYLGLEQSQSHIFSHEDWLVQVWTHWGLCCSSPLFHRAIPSHARVCHYSAPDSASGRL